MIVLLPTAGPAERLSLTLQSLSECQFPNEYRETIVVENGPRSGVEDIVKNFSESLRARYVHVPDRNKSIALNRVLETLDDCFIYFIDDDVRFDPKILMKYSKAARTTSEVFFGGPTLVDYEERPPEWLIPYLPPSARGWSPTIRWVSPRRALDMKVCDSCIESADVNVPVFRGFNWAAFSKDLKQAGGFNPERGPGAKTGATGQEMDMQARLLSIGVKGKYLQHAKVWHYVPKSRCTPKWTLERAHRDGIGRGISEKHADTFLGFPVTMIARLCSLAVTLLLTQAKYNPVARFELRHNLQYILGYRKGLLKRTDKVLPTSGDWKTSTWCVSCRS